MSEQKDILIIDDEEVVIESIKKIAGFNNYSSDSNIDGEEALEKIKVSDFKLIICDIMMPQMDGFRFLEKLNSKGKHIPVIMTTGFSTLENAVKSLHEGAIGFIPKPFTVDELTSIIYRGMNYNNLLRQMRNTFDNRNSDLMVYVPCPPKYFRLGFDSWLKLEDEGIVKVGVTDLFLKSIGSLEKLNLFSTDESVFQGSSCARIECNDQLIHQLLSPVSGKIIDTNNKLTDNVSLIEKDPYFEGWLYKIIPNNIQSELKNLTSCSSDRQ